MTDVICPGDLVVRTGRSPVDIWKSSSLAEHAGVLRYRDVALVIASNTTQNDNVWYLILTKLHLGWISSGFVMKVSANDE